MTAPTDYTYARVGLPAGSQDYHYAEYRGLGFLQAWQASRWSVRSRFDAPKRELLVQATPRSTDTEKLLSGLVRQLRQATEELSVQQEEKLLAVLRNFEAKQCLFDAYSDNYTSKGRKDYAPVSTYLLFAEVLASRYARGGELPFLNALLKTLDKICAEAQQLDDIAGGRLAALIDEEQESILTLCQQFGIELS